MSTQEEQDTLLNAEDSDDEEMDWEEVAVPQDSNAASLNDLHLELEEGPSTRPSIEITLNKRSWEHYFRYRRTGAISHAERLVRIDCHKVHTVALLKNASVRNQWINDPLLQVCARSLARIHGTPHLIPVIGPFAMRGIMFEIAVVRLAEWWSTEFFEVTPSGHLRSRTFDDVQSELLAGGFIDGADKKGKGKAREVDFNPDDDDAEVVKSEKSLMKHALQKWGSRDVSAQLFTSLCRALGIPARLVVSLQSVPWRAGVGKPKTKLKPKNEKGKGEDKIETAEMESEGEMEMEEVEIPATGNFPGDGQKLDGGFIPPNAKAKGKEKVKPPIKLRKTKSKGQTLDSSRPPKPADPTTTPPVFWTEVFSRADARWLPVDPIRAIVNKRKVFDPSSPSSSANASRAISRAARVDNRMSYVIAFEEDGYARDLTPRYAREYGAKVAKAQAGGKGRREWWEKVVGILTRPYRLHRDDLEDDELAANQITEGMPTTISGFKDHPLYVLSRHLHRDQEIDPDTPELGKFRGEPVYPRSSVLTLKTAENWMRRGRSIRAGEQPIKLVKQRAVTIGRKREMEVLKEAGAGADGEGSDIMQGLYAERQTELYMPPPVIDGVIPKNDFGNIDLYVPSMLPAGAVHIPYKGAAKVVRQLGFDFAEAVTSFEFKKRRAFPVITGIVVAADNEQAVLEAYWEQEHNAAIKEQAKRQDAVVKRWTRLVQGLRIRRRLQEQYSSKGDDDEGTNGIEVTIQNPAEQPGGFLAAVDDIVQPFSLPKYQHTVFESPPATPTPRTDRRQQPGSGTASSVLGNSERPSLHMEVVNDDDEDMEEVLPAPLQPMDGAPKTMAELAALHASRIDVAGPRAWSTAALGPEQQPTNAEDDDYRPMPSASNERSIQSFSLGGRLVEGSRNSTPSRAKRTASNTARSSGKKGKGRKRLRDDSDNGQSDIEQESDEPPPTKRTRARASIPALASDRVLRSRRDKSAAQLQQEKEQEEAYRRAVAH
ncbi:hypothetical protein EW146_g8256 [Bondarzewia mesenterica]|uniref:Rad4 beta-hairpin domain-containing protein n=1 Tax=Bondarzewia mesenterica TaxID=1095465 RepID=A0A4S4LGI3_9AGAM|nr:hypothetical protein EW146_g8256 [Bondarzewia mesenterica]